MKDSLPVACLLSRQNLKFSDLRSLLGRVHCAMFEIFVATSREALRNLSRDPFAVMAFNKKHFFLHHVTLFFGPHDNLFKITCLESNRFGFKFPTAVLPLYWF